ncbi:MAG: hypothetical protein IPI00_17555 [Flavobacteriales bacterium]|nr:hypothetical protein [Flavobacteriales bacterium]
MTILPQLITRTKDCMIDYVGEHALAGQLGHFFAILSVVGAMLATVGYFLVRINSIKAGNLWDDWVSGCIR